MTNTNTTDAILANAPAEAVAYKHADPTEGARYLTDRDEAEEIAREDPGLIVWIDRHAEITDEQIEALRTEAGQAGDLDMVAICDRALDGDESAREECTEVIRDAAAQSDQ